MRIRTTKMIVNRIIDGPKFANILLGPNREDPVFSLTESSSASDELAMPKKLPTYDPNSRSSINSPRTMRRSYYRTIRSDDSRVICQMSMVTMNWSALINEYIDVRACLSEKNMRIYQSVNIKLTVAACFAVSCNCSKSAFESYGPILIICFVCAFSSASLVSASTISCGLRKFTSSLSGSARSVVMAFGMQKFKATLNSYWLNSSRSMLQTAFISASSL